MLKYLTKIATDVLPSVAATVIGAYIVNHYINARPAADTRAAAVSTAMPQKADFKAGASKVAKPVETAAIPEPGVAAKGISEKAMMGGERPAEVKPLEVKGPESKPTESKPTESKPTETASAPTNQRHHLILPREKSAAK